MNKYTAFEVYRINLISPTLALLNWLPHLHQCVFRISLTSTTLALLSAGINVFLLVTTGAESCCIQPGPICRTITNKHLRCGNINHTIQATQHMHKIGMAWPWRRQPSTLKDTHERLPTATRDSHHDMVMTCGSKSCRGLLQALLCITLLSSQKSTLICRPRLLVAEALATCHAPIPLAHAYNHHNKPLQAIKGRDMPDKQSNRPAQPACRTVGTICLQAPNSCENTSAGTATRV